MFEIYILPILLNIIASASYDGIKNLMSEVDNSDNDLFRKEMRKAFVKAVKKVRKETNKPKLAEDEESEFKYYQKVILDDIVKLEPTEKKKYINQQLYSAFKDELLKRKSVLTTLNFSVAQECLKHQHEYENILDELSVSVSEVKRIVSDVKGSLGAFYDDYLNSAVFSGMTPSRIVRDINNKKTAIPELHSKRPKLIAELKSRLKERKELLIYAGVQEGKTVTSELLANVLEDYRPVWLDYAYENRLNLEVALLEFDKEEKILFILDGIKYDNTLLYNKLYTVISNASSVNWLFLINSYDKFSNYSTINTDNLIEVELPHLSRNEVEEMIPEEQRTKFVDFIYDRFNGQPLLTHLICTFLTSIDWSINKEIFDTLFLFPKDTPLQRKVRNILQQMVKDDEAYHLLNRLLLLNKPFSEDECRILASISPVITNPIKRLKSLCGTWVEERDELYEISKLLQITLSIDLLPFERDECCLTIADRIIRQSKEISLNDAYRILALLVLAKNEQKAASFYVIILNRLGESDLLESREALLWRLIWMDVPLPEWMSAEAQLYIRIAQLLELVIKRKKKSDFIVQEIEKILDSVNDKSTYKTLAIRILGIYYLMNDDSSKALDYWNAFNRQEPIKGLEGIRDDIYLSLSLNCIKSIEDMQKWVDSYIIAGMPKIQYLSDGLIMVIDQLCNQNNKIKQEEILLEFIQSGVRHGFDSLAIVSCAKLIEQYSIDNRFQEAIQLFYENEDFTKNDLGNILLNYSYGRCLIDSGKTEEGAAFIEKACNATRLDLASAVVMSATFILAQIKANSGLQQEALNILLSLSNNKDYEICYSSREQAMMNGTLTYAYWNVGNRESSIKSLLKVVNWMHKEHDSQSNDYKNISLRTSIVVLYLISEMKGKKVQEDFAVPDYTIFIKPSPTLLDDYKTERNFTVMYFIYELAEHILKNDEISLQLIEEILILQRSDAANMAELLTVLTQSYPLCLKNNRKDLFEYILLGSLAGFAAKKETDYYVDREHTILHIAITIIVMDRICKIAKGIEIDDDWMFELIEKSLVYIPDHKRTDELVKQMRSQKPDYHAIMDELARCAVATFHYETLSIEVAFNVLYSMVTSLLKYNQMPSADHMAKDFAKCFASLLVRVHQKRFTIEVKDIDSYFYKISNLSGIEYLRGILKGLSFKLKSEVSLLKEVEDFINE